ncbi:calcium-binding protein [Fimbriiglobus ruber]|uniref:Uncharacterized protein n=1 Tax=Fimbriiglobus ruber TaxID=1908690 RepID=A0A225DCU5_9BACT|nr:calcium-binding protein [Fimbriiglobus ruber]OWK39400.1 hypothetical protein FRUB_05963 [Fimbriiglobus ruber]
MRWQFLALTVAAFSAIAFFTSFPGAVAGDTKAGRPIEYRDLAFFPKRWEEQKRDTKMTPWEGDRVVFLTTTPDHDPKTMSRFLDRLDGGWKVYADLVGQAPRPLKQVNKKPTIAAIPDASLSCGIGCGYVGSTGIEVGGFYVGDYDLVRKRPDAFPHYYFYEMGRNYYVFGDRHSLFVTGYAVFMRYVCMDALKCDDPETPLRRLIEQAEDVYSRSDVSFLTGFTTLGGFGEKDPRLKDARGQAIHPSDQPVLYASAMLRLRKDYGGDAWAGRFFRTLARCLAIKPESKDAALTQALNWLVAASAAAGKDLTPVFVDRWRFPLAPPTARALKMVQWSDKDLDPVVVLKGLKPEFTPIGTP